MAKKRNLTKAKILESARNLAEELGTISDRKSVV